MVLLSLAGAVLLGEIGASVVRTEASHLKARSYDLDRRRARVSIHRKPTRQPSATLPIGEK